MPSLAAVQTIEDRIGKPVISAAIATTFFLLKEMGLEPVAPNAGALLSGVYA
jgi:maleate isomerase